MLFGFWLLLLTIQAAVAQRLDISFYSNNYSVKGWLFKPAQADVELLPVIIMAPGFSGVKECNYQFFAESFSKEGFAVLLFDYPNFGESEGLNRGEVDPWLQVQAYRDAISFAVIAEGLDPERIGVWGGSYSGGHAIVVSATDSRVKCMVAMTPFISGGYYTSHMPQPNLQFLTEKFNADRLSRMKGIKPAMIPVVSDKEGDFTAVSSPYAWNFVESFKAYAPNFQNMVTLKSLEMQLEYEPGIYVPRIAAIPKLFIIAKEDEVIPEDLIRSAYENAIEPKRLTYLDGNHFSPYMDKIGIASDIAISWFKEHL